MPLLMLLLLQGAQGTPFGVEFQPPAGWLPVDAPPLRAYAAPLPAGQLLLLTVWPAERLGAPADFARWFDGKLRIPGETVLDQAGPERRVANGLEALTATQRVVQPRGGQVVRVIYAIAAGDRVAVAAVTANQDQLVTSHAAVIRAIFEGLRFPPAEPPAPPAAMRAPIPSAGFDGPLPRGMFYRLQSGPGATQLETRVLIFLSGQRVMRVHPFGDGDTIDVERCNPDTCGRYRVEGEWLSVRWDNGAGDRRHLARTGAGFTLDGDAYQPARAVAASEAVGDWVAPGDAGNPSATALRLRADATFEWGAGSAATTLRGRYELRGRSLVLQFADGTSRRYALFAAGRTAPLGLISLDGTVYARR